MSDHDHQKLQEHLDMPPKRSETMKSRPIALAALPPNGPATKLQLSVDTVLAADLEAYREAYAEAHGQRIGLDQLVPAILRAFLHRDRGFQKWKKNTARVAVPPTIHLITNGDPQPLPGSAQSVVDGSGLISSNRDAEGGLPTDGEMQAE